MAAEAKSEKVTCRNCKLQFTPSVLFDFYPDGDDPTVGLCERCVITQALGGGAPAKDPVPIPDGYEKDVCKFGSGPGTCSFLGMTGGGLRCLKGSAMESAIRSRIAEGSMNAQGDNCSGSPDFKVGE